MSNDAATVFNERLFYPTYEIIGGEKILAPSASLTHSGILFRLGIVIGNYIIENDYGYVFLDDTDVHFSDGSIYKPDLVVVKKENENILQWKKGIFGAPDMVVEVLSPSTKIRDFTIKKDTYEKFGVKEYWIIDPFIKSVSVYLLRDGKFELDNEYIYYDEEYFAELTDAEKAAAKFEISPSIFPELKIKLSFIFGWVY